MAYETFVPLDPTTIFEDGTDLSRAYVKIGDFFHKLGFTEKEFRREAAAGRLQVYGYPTKDGGFRDCVVSIANIFAWIRNPETPKELVVKMTRHLQALKTLH